MTDKVKRVFCKDCKNLIVPATQLGKAKCRVAMIDFDPIAGEIRAPSLPEILNRNFDCPHFTPFGAERIRPGRSLPDRPWWKFWG